MANSKHLHEITVPKFDQNFGKNLQDQFSYINNNFHKLAAMKMYAGEDGKSALYIIYNLNAILFYPTAILDGTTQRAFDRRRSIGTGAEFVELAEKIAKAEEELQKDYDKYYELTGKSKEAYSAECWELYFGVDQTNPARCLYSVLYDADENSVYRETITPGSLKYTGENAPLTKGGDVITISRIDWEHSICGCIRTQYAATNRMEKLAATPYLSKTDGKVHWRYATWLMDWALAKDPGTASEIFAEHFLTYDPGKITVACTINDDSTVNFVGSLPYMHIDPRFRSATYPSSEDLTDDEWSIITQARDITCVVYSEPVDKSLQFNVINPFPQLYLGEDGQWYWAINGENTNIPASGPAGEAGRNSQFVVVERMEQLHYYALGRKGRPYTTNVLGNNVEFQENLSKLLPHPIVAGYPYIDYSGPIGIAANINQIRGGYNINALNEPAEDADFWPLFRPYYNLSDQSVYGKGWAQQYSEKFSQENWNNLDSKFTYRVFGIAGGNIFWREYAEGDDADKYKIKIYEPKYLAEINKDPYYTEEIDGDGKATGKLFEYYIDDDKYLMRKYEGESSGKYLYDLVPYAPDENQEVYELMKTLDGCPCIVLPGQLYQKEHYQSTYWFSTLKLCPYDTSKTPIRFMLTAYCSPENMFSTNLDEHSYAGLMMGLDVYEQRYNRFGALHNKPRGYMLPIGSRFIDSSAIMDASKEYSVHIMYSDLGAWENRQDKDAADKAIDWKDVRVPDLTTAWKGVFDKHTMHIGSVMDYRALNDANIEGPAVPGRPGTGVDHGGVGASANYDYRHNCLAELHIDEPVTITNFRDTYFKNILLDVESSLRVGNRAHVNQTSFKPGIGGIYVDGVLSSTQGDQGQAWYTNNGQAAVHYPYSAAGTPVKNISAFKYRTLKGFTYLYPFLTPNTTKTNWNNSGIVGKNLVGDNTNEFDKVEGTNFWSALFRHGLGAQFLTSYNGIAIGGVSMQGDAFAGLKLMFSIDREGNLQHLGKEWRSNTYTNWIWHTLWNDKNGTIYHVNELQFMDSHEPVFEGFNVDTPEILHGCYMAEQARPGTNSPLIYSSHENIPGHVHAASRGFAGELYGGPTVFGNQLYNQGNTIKFIDNICPITTYEVWADVLCNNAALINQGLSPMQQSVNHRARYGAFTTFGQFIGDAARRPFNEYFAVGTDTLQSIIPFYEIPNVINVPNKSEDEQIIYPDYLSENADLWWKNSVETKEIGSDYCDHYPGFGAITIDNGSELLGEDGIGIGLYVRHGAFFESDLFVNRYARFMGNVAMASNVRVGKNLDVHENAHVTGNILIDNNLRAGQAFVDNSVSAKQYFREGATHGQFLMADGRSTRGWVDQKQSIPTSSVPLLVQKYSEFTNDEGVKSPLIIDFGSVYRGARLGKFDIVKDVKLGQENTLEITEVSPDLDVDNVFAWLCQSPATSMRVVNKTFKLFQQDSKDGRGGNAWDSGNYNMVTLNAFCNNCIAYIHMSFPLDYRTQSKDHNNRGLGHRRYNHAYGIKVSGRENDGQADGVNWFTTLICRGFNWDLDMQTTVKENGATYKVTFPKPTHNVQAFVPSLYQNTNWGSSAANWYVKGSDAERSRQYGVLFDITPTGLLRIVDSNAPDALSIDGRVVTRDIWFVYSYEPKGYDPYMMFLSTIDSVQPIKKTPSNISDGTDKVFESTAYVDNGISLNTYKNQCVWIKTYIGGSKPSATDEVWETLEWSLYYNGLNQDISQPTCGISFWRSEQFTKEYSEFEVVPGSEVVPGGEKPPVIGANPKSLGKLYVTTIDRDGNSKEVTSGDSYNAISAAMGVSGTSESISSVTKYEFDDDERRWKENGSISNISDLVNYYYQINTDYVDNLSTYPQGNLKVIKNTFDQFLIKYNAVVIYAKMISDTTPLTTSYSIVYNRAAGGSNANKGFALFTDSGKINNATIDAGYTDHFAMININIPLDCWTRGNSINGGAYHKLNWGWGIKYPGQTCIPFVDGSSNKTTKYAVVNRTYYFRPYLCTGFNWDTCLGSNFPKPAQDIFVYLGSNYSTRGDGGGSEQNYGDGDWKHVVGGGNMVQWSGLTLEGLLKSPNATTQYASTTNVGSTKAGGAWSGLWNNDQKDRGIFWDNEDNREGHSMQFGAWFRLDTSGNLWLWDSNAADFLVNHPGVIATIQFSYPTNSISDPATYTYRFAVYGPTNDAEPDNDDAGHVNWIYATQDNAINHANTLSVSKSAKYIYLGIESTNTSTGAKTYSWQLLKAWTESVDTKYYFSKVILTINDDGTATVNDSDIQLIEEDDDLLDSIPTASENDLINQIPDGYVAIYQKNISSTTTWALIVKKPESAEAIVAAGISSPVTNVSATYGSLLIESDTYWSVFPITIRNDVTPTVSAAAVTATDIGEKGSTYVVVLPGTYSDEEPTAVGGYVVKNDDDKYYMITLERWGKSNGKWKCLLTTDDILKNMWEYVKKACVNQGFSWRTLNECYGQGTPVSPITIKFANALFVIQDIHGVDNLEKYKLSEDTSVDGSKTYYQKSESGIYSALTTPSGAPNEQGWYEKYYDESDPQLTMHGFLRIFASHFKPLAGSHTFMHCYEANVGIHFVFRGDDIFAGTGDNNDRTLLEGTINRLGTPS